MVEVSNNFPTNEYNNFSNVQLDYKDNFLETIVNLLNFYLLNLWRILSGGFSWSSHTVINVLLDIGVVKSNR